MVGVVKWPNTAACDAVIRGFESRRSPQVIRHSSSGQDTTLSRWRSRVRIPYAGPSYGALAQLGRAPALQAGGRRFDPDRLHQVCSVSSVGEHLFYTQGVVGSNPTRSTSHGMAEHWRDQGAVNAPRKLCRFDSYPSHQDTFPDKMAVVAGSYGNQTADKCGVVYRPRKWVAARLPRVGPNYLHDREHGCIAQLDRALPSEGRGPGFESSCDRQNRCVAQLDRAPPCEGGGRRFESYRDGQKSVPCQNREALQGQRSVPLRCAKWMVGRVAMQRVANPYYVRA